MSADLEARAKQTHETKTLRPGASLQLGSPSLKETQRYARHTQTLRACPHTHTHTPTTPRNTMAKEAMCSALELRCEEAVLAEARPKKKGLQDVQSLGAAGASGGGGRGCLRSRVRRRAPLPSHHAFGSSSGWAQDADGSWFRPGRKCDDRFVFQRGCWSCLQQAHWSAFGGPARTARKRRRKPPRPSAPC